MPEVYQQYERTFTSFGGPDIVPMFNNKVIGECQALTYSVRREKAQHENVAARLTKQVPQDWGLLKRSSNRGNPTGCISQGQSRG